MSSAAVEDLVEVIILVSLVFSVFISPLGMFSGEPDHQQSHHHIWHVRGLHVGHDGLCW